MAITILFMKIGHGAVYRKGSSIFSSDAYFYIDRKKESRKEAYLCQRSRLLRRLMIMHLTKNSAFR